jgi:hypothetical protein
MSPFVAIGAVLGFVIFRSDAEHVVALDANAMEERLFRVSGLGFSFGGFVRHGLILARREEEDSTQRTQRAQRGQGTQTTHKAPRNCKENRRASIIGGGGWKVWRGR